ncbi:MAG: hypothetical protein ACPGEF_02210 [Endozoicomonas sp.]
MKGDGYILKSKLIKAKIFLNEISLHHMHANFKKYKVTTLFIAVMFSSSIAQASLERRMVIEVKSQAVHFAIADVNADTDIIYRHLDNGSQSYFSIKTSNNLDNEILAFESITVLRQAFQKLHNRKEHFRVKKIKAVMPNDLFLNSKVDDLQKEIFEQSNINLKVLTDKEQDNIDFFSLITTAEREQNLIALVVGNNNIDFVIANPEFRTITHKIPVGTTCFINYLKEVIQKKQPVSDTSLIPINNREIQQGIDYSRYLLRRLPPEVIEQFNQKKIHILLNKSFTDSLEFLNEYHDKESITKSRIQNFLTDTQAIQPLPNLSNRILSSKFANAILLLGLMEEFDTEKLHTIQRNSTIDILEYPIIWH